jgi:CheY-like chemotaxis protein
VRVALVRLATRDRIEAAGYQVHDAPNADEAIQLLEASPDIGLIFTDVEGFNGRREACSLRAKEMASGQNHRHFRL